MGYKVLMSDIKMCLSALMATAFNSLVKTECPPGKTGEGMSFLWLSHPLLNLGNVMEWVDPVG